MGFLKRLFLALSLLFGILEAGCAPGAAAKQMDNPQDAVSFPAGVPVQDFGLAPELTNTIWINSDTPLRMKDLRGKVVLLDMWTFDCINCRDTIPSLNAWYQRYSTKGLVIIGNHFPEFSQERDLTNLRNAVKDLMIRFPVAQDNDGATWNAYHNLYWPTFYLIDKQGHIRYKHIGEGQYDETEKVIQALLAEPIAQ